MKKSPKFWRTLITVVAVGTLLTELPRARAQTQAAPAQIVVPTHTIDVLADSDSRYRIAGERTPQIVVKAGEALLLRVTARRGKSWNRDGSIHGFSLLRAKDRTKVEGWSLLFRPGTQEFHLVAPSEPGEYIVVCTVICSEEHEGMNMKLLVLP